MIPILYEADEMEFETNGLGRLPDAISCEVVEERNGAYELKMEYPRNGAHCEDIELLRIILAKPNDTTRAQPFRIYRIARATSGKYEIYAEHVSYDLAYIPVKYGMRGHTTVNGMLQEMVSFAAITCPFTFISYIQDTISTSTYLKNPIISMRAMLFSKMIEWCGDLEYIFDRFHVEARRKRGTDSGLTLRYGKDIIDLSSEISSDNLVTGCLPVHVDGDGTIWHPRNWAVTWRSDAAQYPVQRVEAFDSGTIYTAQTQKAAQEYLAEHTVTAESIRLSFLPLWASDEYEFMREFTHLNLCDTVKVLYPAFGIESETEVVKTSYDVLRERYNSIELGSIRPSLATVVTNLTKKAMIEPEDEQPN